MFCHGSGFFSRQITLCTEMTRTLLSGGTALHATLLWASMALLMLAGGIVGVSEGARPVSAATAPMTLDNCMTLETEILVHKEKIYDYNGRRVRLICAGSVRINKCEGYCLSQMSPSVVQFPGFKKDCKCCRESHLAPKHVRLESCYDGTRLVRGQEVMLTVREPQECRCYPCAM